MLPEPCYIVCLKHMLSVKQTLSTYIITENPEPRSRRKKILKLWHLMDVRLLLLFFYGIISLEEYIDGTAGACTYT